MFLSSSRIDPYIVYKVNFKIWPRVTPGQGHSVTQVDAPKSMRFDETNTVAQTPRL